MTNVNDLIDIVTPNTIQHPASFEPYTKANWYMIPIPNGSKAPAHKEWNKKDKCINTIDKLKSVPKGYGMGLAHAYSGTMALDIDHWDRAKEELAKHDINLDDLYNAPDAVIIDSGRKGHGKLLYKTPLGLPINSKKLIDTDETGQKYNYLDFRCGTSDNNTVQDVLPPSIHPDTGEPYRWAGKGKWQALPTIPDSLLDLWLTLNDEDNTVSSTTKLSKEDINWGDIKRALKFISPDLDRDQWVEIGMALHHAGSLSDKLIDAFEVWDEWSSQSESKYKGRKDLVPVWRSFGTNSNSLITINTLFKIATDNGFERITPEFVEKAFKQVNDTVTLSVHELVHTPKPTLDPTLLPKSVADFATEITGSVGCDPVIPMFACLTAVATAIDSRSRLIISDKFIVPPVLWTINIASSGSKKTPAVSPAINMVSKIEADMNLDHGVKLQMYNWELDKYNKKLKQEQSLDADQSYDYNDPTAVADFKKRLSEPKKPRERRLIVTDATSQKILEEMVGSPQGMMMYLDESLTFFNGIVDPKSSESRATYMDCYSGASNIKQERIGRDTERVEHVAMNIFANIQPDSLAGKITNLCTDGFMQRFIPILPDTSKEFVPDHKDMMFIPTDYNTPVERDFKRLLQRLVDTPKFIYKLSSEASVLFKEFEQWVHEFKLLEERVNGDSPFVSSISKLTGLLGRLSLIYHIAEKPAQESGLEKVSIDTVQQCIKLVKTYIIPSYRYFYTELVGNDNNKLLNKVIEFVILHAEEQSFTYKDLLRSLNHFLSSVKVTNRRQRLDIVSTLMIELESSGWVKLIDESSDDRLWAINPIINKQFENRRNEMIENKRKLKEKFEGFK